MPMPKCLDYPRSTIFPSSNPQIKWRHQYLGEMIFVSTMLDEVNKVKEKRASV